MFPIRFQLHQIDDIDYPDFKIGQMVAEDRDCVRDFELRYVAATGHH